MSLTSPLLTSPSSLHSSPESALDIMSNSHRSPSRCFVIGDPVRHSLSPLIHQTGYELLGISDRFSFTWSEVTRDDLTTWIQVARDLQVRGISCTMPHKEAVIPLLDALDSSARAIGAVNTIVNEDGALKGYNTDAIGALRALGRAARRAGLISAPLPARLNAATGFLSGLRVAVLGAGGASRAIIYAARVAGASVCVFNRSPERARELGAEFKIEWAGLEARDRLSEFEVIVNATSVGMGDEAHESLVSPESLHPGQVILETIYSPHATQLVRDARARGAEVALGVEMLLEQAYVQFELYTGRSPPRALISREVGRHLKIDLNHAWPDPSLCGVITGSTLEMFLDQLERAHDPQQGLTLVELRVDAIGVDDAAQLCAHLDVIKAATRLPAILTCRRVQPALQALQDQRSVIKRGVELGFGFIDLDLEDYEALNSLDPLSFGESRLILSAHYYERAPTPLALIETLDRMSHATPFIYKIASVAHTSCEVAQLASLLTAEAARAPGEGRQMIVVAMGSRFALSRALFPLFGSYLTFTALADAESMRSAPGQLVSAELYQIYHALGLKG